jgi:hypothetical protein
MTARYQFLPWVRQGAANTFSHADDLNPVLSLPGGQPLNVFPVSLAINNQTRVDVSIRIYGPGDVTGIDPNIVIRTDPLPGIADFEPNYLACVEFDPPDFPWMFTPAAGNDKGRLRPWLVLVVLPRTQDLSLRFIPNQPLPSLIAPVSELPDLAESWAWTHAQVVQPDESFTIEQILVSQPDQNLSRLVCPRRLRPDTRYLACVVPAFEAGRKAGLGLEVTQDDQDHLRPAWDGTQSQVQLPVYYHWEFGTGAGGDFESLASRIQGLPVPSDVGRRALRVGDLPFGLPDLGVLMMEGALVSTEEFTPPPLDASFQNELRDLLNLSASEPVVTPPIYGRWQASQTEVPEADQPPRWLRELNLDPTVRAAAGLGVRVVQERQEQLVASAWEQLGDAPGVVNLERRLEVAVEVLSSVMRRRLQPMAAGQLVQFLGPAQSRLRLSPRTLHAELTGLGLPSSFVSASFRRFLRPAGTLSRRTFAAVSSLPSLATRLGNTVAPIEPPAGTLGLVTPVLVGAITLLGQITPAQQRYRDAVLAVQTYFNSFTRTRPTAPAGQFTFTAAFKTTLMTSLNPRQTVSSRFFARLSSATGAVQPPARPGESVLSGPTFPQPMYEALRDLSPEFLLPGVGRIEPDTATLLEPNSRFIEAYMVGLNHELAGELLWREFPVNLRQTYFHEFWDTVGALQPINPLPSIHTWDPGQPLGGNSPSGSDQLVLLIRGELLQRYPDALIYAIKAETLSSLGTEEKHPQFRGRIEPDITFLGFDLTEDAARGVGGQPGWFFVIQEQPTAPRFGLDETRTGELNTWNDLSWDDVGPLAAGHLTVGGAAITVPQPGGLVWADNAAHMAAILRQRPVRVALHARRLLPPGQDTQPPPTPPTPPTHPPIHQPIPPISPVVLGG